MKTISRLSSELKVAKRLHSDFEAFNEGGYVVRRVDREDEDRINMARRLLAATYLRLGAVGLDQIEEGVIVDPTVKRSEYFEVVRPEVSGDDMLVTARLVSTDGESVRSLPMHMEELPEDWQNFLDDSSKDPNRLAEVASLVKAEGVCNAAVIAIYATMIYESNHHEWVWGLQPGVDRNLRRLLGRKCVIEKMGDDYVHLGHLKSRYRPGYMDVERARTQLARPGWLVRLNDFSQVYDFMAGFQPVGQEQMA
jgi:hypothetical protein